MRPLPRGARTLVAIARERRGSMHENAPVTVLQDEGRVLHIVGTAHVSSRSVEEVR